MKAPYSMAVMLSGNSTVPHRRPQLLKARCPMLFNALLLPKTGNGIGVRKRGVIVQRLLIEKICVCLYRLFFRCRRCPVGFQLMAAYAALNCPRRHAARFLSGKFYPVPAFHTDVFFLYLVDFPMYGTV